MTSGDVLERVGDADLSSAAVRLPRLDTLRASVVLVMLAHFANFDDPAAGEWLLRALLLVAQMAFVGLDVFFVLSGFLITRILLDARGSTFYFRNFFARRALRILPLYYGILLIYLTLVPSLIGGLTTGGPVPLWDQAFFWTYLQNLWLAITPVGNPESDVTFLTSTSHLWSLAVEEQFYLVWPVVVYWLSPRALKWTCAACVLFSPLWRLGWVLTAGAGTAVYVLTPARMDGLALGALIAILIREGHGIATLARWARWTGSLSLLVLLVLLAPETSHGNFTPVFLTVGLTASVHLSGAILVGALGARPNGALHRALMFTPLRRIGTYSYATYVLHFPVAFLLEHTGVLTRSMFHDWFPGRAAGELGYSVTLIILCIGLGALSWHLLERPILSLRRYFTGRPVAWTRPRAPTFQPPGP